MNESDVSNVLATVVRRVEKLEDRNRGLKDDGTVKTTSIGSHRHGADEVRYTPSAGADPGNADDAIDDLRERVSDIEGGAGTWLPIAEWFIPGPLEASTTVHQGKVIKLPPWANAATLVEGSSIHANVATPPTGADIELDITVSTDHDASPSETSLFADGSPNYPTIDIGDYHTGETGDSDDGTLTTLSLAGSSYMRLKVRQVGSTERGRDLTVVVYARVRIEF